MAKPLRLGVVYDFRNPPDSGIDHQRALRRDPRSGGVARRARPRPRVVHRAPLRRRRLPAVVDAGRRRDGGAHHARALLVRHLPAAVQPPGAARRGSRGARQPERRARGDRRGHGLRAARVPRLRHPAAAAACRGPTKGSRCCSAPSPARRSASTASATTSTRDDPPGYVQPGGPPLWIAAMSEAGALRAARFDAQPAAAGRARRSRSTPGGEARGGGPRSGQRIASASSAPAS